MGTVKPVEQAVRPIVLGYVNLVGKEQIVKHHVRLSARNALMQLAVRSARILSSKLSVIKVLIF